MVCGCLVCGTLMVHSEKGIYSTCVCPACDNRCDDCLGSGTPIQKGEQLPEDFEEKIRYSNA